MKGDLRTVGKDTNKMGDENMQTIIHKRFGVGEVVNKQVKENATYITVRFCDGKEIVMSIPLSFEIGVAQPLGTLKEEVDQAIAKKRAKAEKIALERQATNTVVETTPVVSKKRIGKKPTGKVKSKGSIQTKYEAYLESAGYPVVGISGNDSTVPAYSRAVKKVIKNESITWVDLEKNISTIIAKYDVGGGCEDLGNQSNKTVINALKRFGEFVA